MAMPKPQKAWSIKVPRSTVIGDLDRSTLMLRLGAAVNAMRSAQRWFLSVRNLRGPGGARDRIGTLLVACAYLKEAIDGLLRPNYKVIVRLARQRGASAELIRALEKIRSRKKGSLYTSILQHTRNKLAFHWDREPFRNWAQSYDKDTITWVRGVGMRNSEAVQWASSDAIVSSISPGASATKLAKELRRVTDATKIVVDVLELAIRAYLVPHASRLQRASHEE